MINEFSSALINKRFDDQRVGGDYRDPGWRERRCDPHTEAVRSCVLVNPDNPESCNWRAVEIRRLIKRSDLLSTLSVFDQRTGYALDDMLATLTARFRPSVEILSGDATLNVRGKYQSDAYQLTNWRITTSGLQWTIQRKSLNWSGSRTAADTPIALPGTQSQLYIKGDGDFNLLWAAKPTVDICQTASQLRETCDTAVAELGRLPSRLPDAEKELLVRVVRYDAESPAQVCAAAILVAGRTLHVSA